MLDNRVVDQTCLKVLPTETWDLCLLCFKKNKIKIKFQGCIYSILNVIDVFIKLHQNYLNFV